MNSSGQLGIGTTTQRNVPVVVPGLSGVIAVSAGGRHTLALLADGTVRAWGDNRNGQLGDGTTDNALSPVEVSGLVDVVGIAAGMGHSVAVLGDGTVRAWGRNTEGQLGDDSTVQRLSPVAVFGLSDVVSVSAGGHDRFNGLQGHTLALKSDGTVFGWGLNGSGQLGDGTFTDRSVPVQVSGLSEVVLVVAGSAHSVVW